MVRQKERALRKEKFNVNMIFEKLISVFKAGYQSLFCKNRITIAFILTQDMLTSVETMKPCKLIISNFCSRQC